MAQSLIGNLAVNLSMETAAFEAGATRASKALKKTQREFAAMGDKFTSIGKTMTLGITAPLAAIALKSFDTAKDVEEMQSAFDVTFGSMSASVRKWAEETGNAMGRSTQEIQSGALAFQELFSKALDPAKSAAMSKSFAVLTQDLASFKNLSNEVAQQKLFSGLSGEAEPLRAVGVFLSEAKVQAAALALGLVAVNGKLTEEQKILARAAVIQQELNKASGDVLRTQGSTANKLKEVKAQWEELQVIIGEKVIPLLKPLIEKLVSVLEWFVKLPKPVQDTALAIVAVTAAIGPSLIGIGGLIKAAGLLLPLMVATGPAGTTAAVGLGSMTAVLGPLAIAAGIAYLAFKNWDKIKPIVDDVAANFKTKTGEIQTYLDGLNGRIAALDKRMGSPSKTEITDAIGKAFVDMAADVQAATDQANADIKTFDAGIESELASAMATVERWDASIAQSLRSAGDKWEAFSARAHTAVGNMVTKISAWLGPKLSAAVEGAKSAAQKVGDWFYKMQDRVTGHSYVPDMIAAIGVEMAKLDALMVAPAKAAASETADAMRDLQGRVSNLLAELFPEQAQEILFKKQLADINAEAMRANWSVGALAETIERLKVARGLVKIETEELTAEGESDSSNMPNEWGVFMFEQLGKFGDEAKKTTAEVAESFGQMATDAIGSVRSMVDSFKSGDILGGIQDLLDLVVNVISALGSIGVIKGAAPAFGGPRAKGGPVVPGKSYLVGENGPEFVTPRRRGFVHPNGSGGGSSRVQIVPSPYFHAVVDGRVVKGAAPMAAQAAMIGASAGESRIMRRASRRLP